MKNSKKLDKAVLIKSKKNATNADYNTKAGDAGEDFVKSKLIFSKYPMYLLHDVRLVHEGKSAQIDFLAVTRRMIFVIECKNYGCNVKIDSDGQFINTTENKSFPSPTEQNREHIDVLKRIFPELAARFYPLIVFSNTSRILDRSEAGKEIKNHIVKVDELLPAMERANEDNRQRGIILKKGVCDLYDEEMKQYAENFAKLHTPVDLPKKPASEKKQSKSYRCPKCSGIVRKGQYGFFCENKCGMNISRIIYNQELTEQQIIMLLSGRSTQVETKFGRKTVFPEVEQNDYKGQTKFQWRREE